MYSYSQHASREILRSLTGGEDPWVVAAQVALRDKLIAGELSDKDSIAYKAGMFLRSVCGDPSAARWCRDAKITVKAQATNPNTAGGILVPEEIAATVLLLLESFGVVRREATTWPMGSDSITVPRMLNTWTPVWIAENSAPVTSTLNPFDGLTLSAKKLGVLAPFSSELFEDAATEALGLALIGGLGEAFSGAEDDAAFNGDGTSAYAGLRGLAFLLADGNHNAGKYTAAAGHITYGTLDATDITGMMALLPGRALPNAKFYVSQACYSATLVRLAAESGNALMMGPDGPVYLGFPIVISQKLPLVTTTLANKAMMFFGDMKRAIAMGARRDLAIQRFNETFATLDQVLIRSTERLDIVCHDLGNDTTAGALVGLFAPAS
jgi:HK97 family phage major capsid protein